VSRRYFKRENRGGEWILTPLADGAPLAVGDEVEVRSRSGRSTRRSTFTSATRVPPGSSRRVRCPRCRWDLGIALVRGDPRLGSELLFREAPPGEYPFKYRVRAATAGTFRVAPATVQSM